MASRSSFVPDLHDQVYCPVCAKFFVESIEPKALGACCHTVCGNCTKELMRNGRIACPTCGEVSKEGEVVDDNRFRNFVELYQKQSQNQTAVVTKAIETKDCPLCEEKGQEFFCNGCGRYLCSTCLKVHIKTRTCQEGQSEQIADKLQNIVNSLDNQNNELKRENERFQKDSKRDINETNKVCSECIKEIDDYEDKFVQRIQETCKQEREKVLRWKNEHLSRSAERRDDLSSTAVQMMESISAVKQSSTELKAKHESLQEQINCELERFKIEKWDALSLQLTNATVDAFKPEDVLKVIRTTDVTELDLRKRFRLKAEVSPSIGLIEDLLVLDNKLIALVQHKDCTKLVESNDEGENIKIICSEGLGEAESVAASGGILLVASKDKGLLAVTLDGQVETLARGKYCDSYTAEDGTVYAVRVTTEREPVCIDIMVNKKLIRTVDTQIMWFGGNLSVITCFTSNVALVASCDDHCVYEVSLTDGSTLKTHGSKGSVSPGELCGPRLCFKSNHNILVTDMGNDRLQVFNTITKSWSIFDASVTLGRTCAAINKGGKLYVAGFPKSKSYILE